MWELLTGEVLQSPHLQVPPESAQKTLNAIILGETENTESIKGNLKIKEIVSKLKIYEGKKKLTDIWVDFV